MKNNFYPRLCLLNAFFFLPFNSSAEGETEHLCVLVVKFISLKF